MEWITFYQGQRDNVYFITSKNSERDFMPYYSFLTYINEEYKISNFFELKDAVDKFKVILLFENNTWEIIPDEIQDASFQELYELNKEDEEKSKSPFDKKVEQEKIKLNSIFDFRKKDLLNRYNRRK